MSEHKSLYIYSLSEAVRNNEKDLRRESYKENCDCARAIEKAIAENYRNNVLNDCAQPIIEKYGFNRVNWVLANTVLQNKEDGRFSEDNKRWARAFHIPREDVNWHFSVESHLLKLILTNLRESGKLIICLDPESEYEEICSALGGCYIDFLSGEYTINPLEPKAWADGVDDVDSDVPTAFKKATRLSQHIAFLKDFFRSYKDFSDSQIDTIEILLSKLYARFGITDSTDYSRLKPTDYPIMEDFYKLCEEEFYSYDKSRKYLYTEETLQEVCLGIHSMCVGAESKYFNGHTNITDDVFLVFGVKGLMDTNKRLKDAMLFNILSFMSNQLLGKGNTAASIDELYLFLTNMTAIEYIRNAMKRVRKKESSIILASQNIEDFLIPSIREFTKPLFSIPTHQFLFNAGQINPKEYMDALQVESAEFELIKYPERGTCLYRCGNERYLLQVIAPDYKSVLFGKAGGR